MSFLIEDVPNLSSDDYDACQKIAEERVKAKIGEKPKRKDFKMEYGSIFDTINTLKILVFLGALVISTLAMFYSVGENVGEIYEQVAAGLNIDITVTAVLTQLSAATLAEASILIFVILLNREFNKGDDKNKYHFAIYLILATLASFFVFYVNISHGVFVGYLAPFFTIGIGISLEPLLDELLQRKEATTRRYQQALNIYENAVKDITTHPNYKVFLYQEIWNSITKIAFTKRGTVRSGMEHLEGLKNVDKKVRVALVRREIENRESWEGIEFTNLSHDEVEYDTNPKAIETYLLPNGFYESREAKKYKWIWRHNGNTRNFSSRLTRLQTVMTEVRRMYANEEIESEEFQDYQELFEEERKLMNE